MNIKDKIKSFFENFQGDSLKVQGYITIERFDKNGKLVEKRQIKNLVTNAGFAEIANLAGNVSSPTAFTYLAVGTGTNAASASDTTLQTEISDSGLSRAAATVTRVTTTQTNDTLQLAKTFTVTGTKAVTECGAFNAGSSGTMLGRQVFTAVNVVNGDSLAVTYKFKFS